MHVIASFGGAEAVGSGVEASLGKIVRPWLKTIK
jgi:hypothetical protein